MFDFIKLQEKDVFLTLKNLIFLELLILMVAELCFLVCFCRGTINIKGGSKMKKAAPRQAALAGAAFFRSLLGGCPVEAIRLENHSIL